MISKCVKSAYFLRQRHSEFSKFLCFLEFLFSFNVAILGENINIQCSDWRDSCRLLL